MTCFIRIVHHDKKRDCGYVVVNNYRYYSHVLDHFTKSAVEVECLNPGPNCEKVNIYTNGIFIGEAVRPHLFDKEGNKN